MNSVELKLAEVVVNTWLLSWNKGKADFKFRTETITETFSEIKNACHAQLNTRWQFLLEYAPETVNRANDKNRITGCGFNSLQFFNIGETLHSLLLAFLLDPNASHGQKNLFLKEFLQMIGIEEPGKGHWVVTAEKYRIDVLLRRTDPKSTIIIENKSNNAVDGRNQLYRYWYEQIYKKNQQQDFKDNDLSRRYRIVYLPVSEGRELTKDTLSCPERLKEQNPDLPDMVPLKVDKRSFQDFVVLWLERCEMQIPVSNYRLREYVKQYIELWK